MKRKIVQRLTLILIVGLMALSILIMFNLTRLSLTLQEKNIYGEGHVPKYHYMVILDGSDHAFVTDMKKGMDSGVEDYGIVYELWAFKGKEMQEQIKEQMDIGIESEVDGIIIQTFEDLEFKELFIKAKRRGVPIITISNDVPSEEKVGFIAYNRYKMGSQIGRILNEALISNYKGNGTVVLLQNSTLVGYDQALAIQEELYSDYKVEPIRLASQSENSLNIQELVYEIIKEHKDLKAIICLSEETTLGVVQAIKDMNKVGDIVVIGSGDQQIVLDYIQRGILHATIVADNQKIGYEAILDMTKYCDGYFVSQYRNISVEILRKGNLKAYLEKREGTE